MNHYDIYTQKFKCDPFNLFLILFYANEIIRFANTKEKPFLLMLHFRFKNTNSWDPSNYKLLGLFFDRHKKGHNLHCDR